jgi:hypothetical protein
MHVHIEKAMRLQIVDENRGAAFLCDPGIGAATGCVDAVIADA